MRCTTLLAQAASSSVETGLPTQKEVLASTAGRATRGGDKSSLQPPTGLTLQRTATSLVEVASQKLNAEQRCAVANFMEADATCPYTLFGPPGTGKTVTLTECCLQVSPSPSHPGNCV